MFIIIILAIHYYIVKVQFETRFKLSFYGEVPKKIVKNGDIKI